jgi:hypothetical protein
MAKSRFNIHGTKDFLVAAVFCGFLCLWSIRDAWFPSQNVQKKHPREVAVTFKVSGVLKEIPVKVGQAVGGKMVLASLYEETHHSVVAEAEAAFDVAREAKSPDVDHKLDVLMAARADLEACTVRTSDILVPTAHGEDTLRGTVVRMVAEPATEIQAGAPVLMVAPVDSFYAFNKTLAVLSFIGMMVALVFHRIASK